MSSFSSSRWGGDGGSKVSVVTYLGDFSLFATKWSCTVNGSNSYSFHSNISRQTIRKRKHNKAITIYGCGASLSYSHAEQKVFWGTFMSQPIKIQDFQGQSTAVYILETGIQIIILFEIVCTMINQFPSNNTSVLKPSSLSSSLYLISLFLW